MEIRIKANEFSFSEEILPLSVQYAILEKSNLLLEKDLDELAKSLKNIENAQHLWATTWVPLRLDDLQGIALYYYLIEVIKYLDKNYDDKRIKVIGEFDKYFKTYLENQYLKVNVKRKLSKSYVKSRIRLKLSPVYYITKALFKKKNTERINAKVWLSAPFNIEKHRYKHLLDSIKYDKAFYSGWLREKVDAKSRGSSLDFIAYLSIKDVFKAIKESIRLKKYKNNIIVSSLIDYAVKAIPLEQITATLLIETSVGKAIEINKPKQILFTTANTYPPARTIARKAYLNKVPFIIVACRPMFTKARLEERLINADREKINDAHVADAYAVWDVYSKRTLMDQGVDASRIYITNQEAANFKNKQKLEKFENAILILFTHEENLNQRFIDELLKLKTTKDIVIRQHPLKTLNNKQLELLHNKFTIIGDITAQSYSNYEFKNTMALTINSTAILEAVSHGCGAIWLPYLNSRSLLFYEIMTSLGVIAESVEDLETVLAKDNNGVELLIENCQAQYIKKFRAKDETSEFLEQMKLI